MQTHKDIQKQLIIRKMEAKDCEAVFAVEKACFPATTWKLGDFKDAVHMQGQYYYLAELDGVVVGFAAIMVMIDTADLINIGVLDSYRGLGIASRLMQILMEQARELGLIAMTLEVRESNDNAIRLYERYEFAAISKRKQYYANPVEDAVIMQRAF